MTVSYEKFYNRGMKVKKEMKKNGEYKEYKAIIKMVDEAYKKALLFNKTDSQKKLEKAFRFCWTIIFEELKKTKRVEDVWTPYFPYKVK